MRVIRIFIKRLMGIEELELAPGAFTLIESSNGLGKSSVIEALKSVFGGGSDFSLVRVGSQSAEVVVDLGDEHLEGPINISKTIGATAADSSLTVTHPEMGRMSRPQQWLNSLLPALSISPVEFLLGTEKRQLEILFAALPLKVTSEQIAAITKDPAHVESYRFPCGNQHALEVLGTVEKVQYEQRTGINRALKEKQASVNELRTTVPDDAGEPGEWADNIADLEQRLVELTAEHTVALGDAEKDAKAAKHAAEMERSEARTAASDAATARLNQLSATEQAEIDAIRAKYAEQRRGIEGFRDASYAGAQTEYEATVKETDAALTTARTEVAQRFEPQQHELAEQLGTARARVEQEAGHAKTREILSRMEREAAKFQAESTRLTNAIEGLRDLRATLTAELPIAGLEVKDGALFVDGISFKRVNEARRIQIAVEVVLLKTGKLGFICLDGAERLDSEHLALLAAELAKRGVQAICCRVTDDKELTVRSMPEAAAKPSDEQADEDQISY